MSQKKTAKKPGLLPSRLYCRLWIFTTSAFARGLLTFMISITAGREFHPALKTVLAYQIYHNQSSILY